MFEFFTFLDHHGVLSTALVCAVSVIFMFVYRDLRAATRDHQWKMETLKDLTSHVLQIKRNNEEILGIVKTACDGHPCENHNQTVKLFSELSETVHKFEREGRESRTATKEAIDRIERNISAFTNDLGREIVRFLRNGRGSHSDV